jgi:tetratricopeptide (TPR) repeat protein
MYKIRGLYLYAETYEAQEQYNKAVDCLNLIEQIDISMQATDDNIYAKSLLHLGRLHFRQENLELSYKNLNKFFKKAKNIDNKELLDIARVNLGMIRGTQGINDFIDLINKTDYSDFMKMKLKYFADSG